MIYVLIVVSYFAGAGGHGQTIHFQEFNNLQACDDAKRFLIDNRFSRYSHDNYKVTCLPKGDVK